MEDKLIQLIEDFIRTEKMPEVEKHYTKDEMLKQLREEYYILTGKRIEDSEKYKKLKNEK